MYAVETTLKRSSVIQLRKNFDRMQWKAIDVDRADRAESLKEARSICDDLNLGEIDEDQARRRAVQPSS